MRYKKFEGENLYFSPLDVNDVQTFTRWINDETLVRGLNSSVSKNISELSEKSYLEKASADMDKYQFSVIKKEDDKLIGSYDLHDIELIHQFAEVGGFIGEIDERGKGYGTEALRMVCDYGFNVLNLRCLIGKIWAFNTASIRPLEKVGFKKVGEIKQRYYYNGKFYTEYTFQITKEEFYKKWETFVKPF